MKTNLSLAALTILVLALLVVSTYAQGYPPEVIVVEPPQIIIVDHRIDVTLALVYPDGTPVVLDPPRLTIRACGAEACITIEVAVNPDGTFSIPITPDFPTGTVTLYIVANSMRDSFGATFPSVDTEIGTITVPSAESAGSAPESQNRNPPETGMKPTGVFRVAQHAATQETVQQSSPNHAIPSLLSLLVIAGAVMMLPRRRYAPAA